MINLWQISTEYLHTHTHTHTHTHKHTQTYKKHTYAHTHTYVFWMNLISKYKFSTYIPTKNLSIYLSIYPSSLILT